MFAWAGAMLGEPMFLIVWAYVCLWGSIVLYGIPIIFLIIHAIAEGTQRTVNWTTDGCLPHIIIDVFLWVLTAIFHYFFYPALVLHYSQ